MPLPRRLGLETASIPHADRHGLAWLSRCRLWSADCGQQTAHSASRRPGAETLNRATMPWSIHCGARSAALKIFTSCLEFPRSRGDGPIVYPAFACLLWFPPRARGWTCSAEAHNDRVAVSPAYAGIGR